MRVVWLSGASLDHFHHLYYIHKVTYDSLLYFLREEVLRMSEITSLILRHKWDKIMQDFLRIRTLQKSLEEANSVSQIIILPLSSHESAVCVTSFEQLIGYQLKFLRIIQVIHLILSNGLDRVENIHLLFHLVISIELVVGLDWRVKSATWK